MNYPNKRFYFDIAKKEDSNELLEIIEEEYFRGRISLLYTRRPDPYESFRKEGDNVKIIVLRDSLKNKIAGFGVCAVRNLYINGKEEKAGYLFSLRARKEYMKKVPLLHRGYEYLKNLFPDVKYFYTTILEENLYVRKMLEKRREFMPVYEYLGDYIVYSIKTGEDKPRGDYKVRRCEHNLDDMVEFMNKIGKSYQFFPVIKKEDLKKGNFYGLSHKDFYTVYKGNKIKACFALWDQREYKQHILKEYKGIFRIIYPFSFLLRILGYPGLPHPGSVLKFFYLSFISIDDEDSEIFEYIIKFIRNLKKDYPFFTVGLFEKSKFNEVMKKFKTIKYKSRVYLVRWKDKKVEFNKNLPIYIEAGML